MVLNGITTTKTTCIYVIEGSDISTIKNYKDRSLYSKKAKVQDQSQNPLLLMTHAYILSFWKSYNLDNVKMAVGAKTPTTKQASFHVFTET